MVSGVQYPEQQLETTSQFQQPIAHVSQLLAEFRPISLSEMENVKLLNRTDTKYILRLSQLRQVLAHITDQYWVLEAANTRLNHYQTLYFDTPEFTLYHQHHNGLRSRYKVRTREYVDSDLTFCEVKRKTNKERTIKSRLQTSIHSHNKKINEFVGGHAPVDPQDLEPKLWNRFIRITLVSKHSPERLTLDLNLEFGWGDATTDLPGIVIAEVKRERVSQRSEFVQQMRELGIRPARFSKYCAGVYMLYDGIKTNNFKPRMRLVEKFMQEEASEQGVSYEYTR